MDDLGVPPFKETPICCIIIPSPKTNGWTPKLPKSIRKEIPLPRPIIFRLRPLVFQECTLPETNIFRTWKWMVRSLVSFWAYFGPIFKGCGCWFSGSVTTFHAFFASCRVFPGATVPFPGATVAFPGATVDGNQKSGTNTSWYGNYPHYLRRVSYIPGGERQISDPSTVYWFISFRKGILKPGLGCRKPCGKIVYSANLNWCFHRNFWTINRYHSF